MSDMEVQPDPIIRTALQRLPIPAHTDGFWSRLNAELDIEAPPQTDGRTVLVAAPEPDDGEAPDEAAGPAPTSERDPALALVPKALRRTSNGVLLAVAAAAAVVVTLAGTALLEDRTGQQIASDDISESAATLQDQVDDAQSDAEVATLSEAGVEASSDAVLGWVDDLGAGDGTAAWQALGEASQAHFTSREAFEGEMAALVEDYGEWSDAEPEDVLVTAVKTDDEGTMAVVTLVGTVDHDGVSERRADAVPVRVVDGEAVVEPFTDAGAIELVVPEVAMDEEVADTPVGLDDELVVVVPSDATAPVLRLDDGETIVCGQTEGSELSDLEEAAGQRCSYLPPEDLAPGEHTLTTAFLGADGASISAASALFEAA